MKIRPKAIRNNIVNTAIKPINALITAVNLTIQFTPVVLRVAKLMFGAPKWLIDTRRDIRQVGLYEFVDHAGRKFNLLLTDSVAADAIEDSNALGARELVLKELRHAVEIDQRCPDFASPEAIYLWSHPAKGFKSIVRLRNATASERKEYAGRPVRSGLVEYLVSLAEQR